MRLNRIGYAEGMPRWAADARERLEAAALDLFVEQGYEQTTVTQIADQAGLNRATFFRHFDDKREVLFGEQDRLAGLLADGVRAASGDAQIFDCLQAAFAAVDRVMTPQQRDKAAQRVQVMKASTEVRERGLLKQARIAEAIAAALRDRGADQITARLGAQIGLLAFSLAVERWINTKDQPFALCAAGVLRELQTRTQTLGSQASPLGRGRSKGPVAQSDAVS